MSYFRPFTHGVITQNTNHRNITHVYRDHSARTSIGKAEGEDKESNRKWHRKEGVRSKKWYPSRKFSLYFFSVTQSILLGFSWNSNNIKVSSLYIHMCLKNQLCLKMRFSTSFDITWYDEAAIYAKNLLFSSHSIVSWWSLVNNTGELME